MERQKSRGNEEGSVMLVAMMVMFLLTLMGLAATRSSVFEIKMADNQRTLDEEFAKAETALSLAIRHFRDISMGNGGTGDESGAEGGDSPQDTMAALLNDTDYPENHKVSCTEDRILDGVILARVEVRRIYLPETPEQRVVESLTTPQANAVPELSHRFYDGSIDRKRFALTATAMRKGTNQLSSTWVQKGVALPAEQDRDLF